MPPSLDDKLQVGFEILAALKKLRKAARKLERIMRSYGLTQDEIDDSDLIPSLPTMPEPISPPGNPEEYAKLITNIIFADLEREAVEQSAQEAAAE